MGGEKQMIVETYRGFDIVEVSKMGRAMYKALSTSHSTGELARKCINERVYGTNKYLEFNSCGTIWENEETVETILHLRGSKSNIGSKTPYPTMQLGVI